MANALAIMLEGTATGVLGWAVEIGVLVEGTGRGVGMRKGGEESIHIGIRESF